MSQLRTARRSSTARYGMCSMQALPWRCCPEAPGAWRWHSCASSDTDQLSQKPRIFEQWLARMVVDQPAAIQDDRARRELQCQPRMLFDQHDGKPVVLTQPVQRSEQPVDDDRR